MITVRYLVSVRRFSVWALHLHRPRVAVRGRQWAICVGFVADIRPRIVSLPKS